VDTTQEAASEKSNQLKSLSNPECSKSILLQHPEVPADLVIRLACVAKSQRQKRLAAAMTGEKHPCKNRKPT
jgi:hypothetical protein